MSTPEADLPEDDGGGVEAVLVVTTADPALADLLAPLFPDPDDLSVAKRALGGAEIKAWFVVGKAVIGKLFDALSRHRGKVESAAVIVGTDRLSITGYSKDDALALLETPAMRKAMAAYAGRKPAAPKKKDGEPASRTAAAKKNGKPAAGSAAAKKVGKPAAKAAAAKKTAS